MVRVCHPRSTCGGCSDLGSTVLQHTKGWTPEPASFTAPQEMATYPSTLSPVILLPKACEDQEGNYSKLNTWKATCWRFCVTDRPRRPACSPNLAVIALHNGPKVVHTPPSGMRDLLHRRVLRSLSSSFLISSLNKELRRGIHFGEEKSYLRAKCYSY